MPVCETARWRPKKCCREPVNASSLPSDCKIRNCGKTEPSPGAGPGAADRIFVLKRVAWPCSVLRCPLRSKAESVIQSRRTPGDFNTGSPLLGAQTPFDHSLGDSCFSPLFGGLNHFQHHLSYSFQAIQPVLFSIAIALAVHAENTGSGQPPPFGFPQSCHHIFRQRLIAVQIPGQLDLGIHFVDVLSPRPGTPDIRKPKFRQGDPDCFGDVEMSGPF